MTCGETLCPRCDTSTAPDCRQCAVDWKNDTLEVLAPGGRGPSAPLPQRPPRARDRSGRRAARLAHGAPRVRLPQSHRPRAWGFQGGFQPTQPGSRLASGANSPTIWPRSGPGRLRSVRRNIASSSWQTPWPFLIPICRESRPRVGPEFRLQLATCKCHPLDSTWISQIICFRFRFRGFSFPWLLLSILTSGRGLP